MPSALTLSIHTSVQLAKLMQKFESMSNVYHTQSATVLQNSWHASVELTDENARLKPWQMPLRSQLS